MSVRTAGHGRLRATVRVRNTGNRALHDVRTRVVDNGGVVGAVVLATVRPGTTRTVTATWRPGHRAVHHVAARVDPRNRITESNERDNRLSRTFRR
jgi:subtilase family serine protease